MSRSREKWLLGPSTGDSHGAPDVVYGRSCSALGVESGVMAMETAGRVPRLDHGTSELWWARAGDAHPSLFSLLDGVERARLESQRRAADRNRFLISCALARLALSEYLGAQPDGISLSRLCPACGRPHGKPRLSVPRSTIEFSLAHSGERIVAAFNAGSSIGVDVEELQRGIGTADLVASALTPEEAAELGRVHGGARDRAFLIYWTRKEAVAKAIGKGLTLPLSSIVVSAHDEHPRLLRPLAGAEEIVLADVDAGEGYVASLAVLGHCDRVVWLDGSSLIERWKARAADTAM